MLTDHALIRAAQRGVSLEDIERVMAYGTCIHHRGADHYMMGGREVELHAQKGRDLKELEGYRVVCSPVGVVLTVYRQTRRSHRRPRSLRQLSSSRRRTSFKAGTDAMLKRFEWL